MKATTPLLFACFVLLACGDPKVEALPSPTPAPEAPAPDAPEPEGEGEVDAEPVRDPLPGDIVQKRGRAWTGTFLAPGLAAGDHVDVQAVLKDPNTGEWVTVTAAQNIIVLEVEPAGDFTVDTRLLLLPEEVEVLSLAQALGSIHLTRRPLESLGVLEVKGRATINTLITGERTQELRKKRMFTGAKKLRAFPLEVPASFALMAGDRVDVISVLEEPQTKEQVATTLLQNVLISEVVEAKDARLVWIELVPEEAEVLALARHLGELLLTLRHPDDMDVLETKGRATINTVLTGERTQELRKKRMFSIQVIRGQAADSAGVGSTMDAGGYAPAPSGSWSSAVADTPAFGTERYSGKTPNGWVRTRDDALSTFGIDVDAGSFTFIRKKLELGQPIPKDAVRVEEVLNYFDHGYQGPTDGRPFAVVVDGAPSPYAEDEWLLRVGVQGRRVRAEERKPVDLTFLVDVSCSMQDQDKLPLAQESLEVLVDNLRPDDTVALLTYAGASEVVLPTTSAGKTRRIKQAIRGLGTRGGTHMSAGLDTAYALAERALAPGRISRVIVLSDGDANIGTTEAGGMLARIKKGVAEGVTMTTLGFGTGNYQEATMEPLANAGNGNYYYVDSLAEARRVFVDRLAGTLETIAKDVKLQVVFDPKVVERYRLIGYENRDVADEDFENDRVDGGELGAGHSVTALYALKLATDLPQGRVGEVRARWKAPRGDTSTGATWAFDVGRLHPTLAVAPSNLSFAAGLMGLAEVLRQSPDARHWNKRRIQKLACAGDTVTGDWPVACAMAVTALK